MKAIKFAAQGSKSLLKVVIGPLALALAFGLPQTAFAKGTPQQRLSCAHQLSASALVIPHSRRLVPSDEPLRFHPGDIVHGTFILRPIFKKNQELNRARLGLVYDNAMMDQRHADVFEIEIPPKDFAAYAETFSRRYTGYVRVTEAPKGRFVVSHALDYKGEVVGDITEISVRNPTPAQLRELPEGTPVTVEGAVLKVESGHLKMEVGGRLVAVTFNRHSMRYYWSTDPAREWMIGEPVAELDRVRILGTVLNGAVYASSQHSVTLLCLSGERCESHSAQARLEPPARESLLNKIRRAVFGRRR